MHYKASGLQKPCKKARSNHLRGLFSFSPLHGRIAPLPQCSKARGVLQQCRAERKPFEPVHTFIYFVCLRSSSRREAVNWVNTIRRLCARMVPCLSRPLLRRHTEQFMNPSPSTPSNSALSPTPMHERVFETRDHAALWFSLGVGLLVMQVGEYLLPAL